MSMAIWPSDVVSFFFPSFFFPCFEDGILSQMHGLIFQGLAAQEGVFSEVCVRFHSSVVNFIACSGRIIPLFLTHTHSLFVYVSP